MLDITSNDVAHSWWIPKLGGKMDAIPGYTNKTWFKANKTGIFKGQCAEFCGRNHANMHGEREGRAVAEYLAWYDQQAADIKAAREAGAKQRAGILKQEQDAAQRSESEQEDSETPMATTSEPPGTDTTACTPSRGPRSRARRRRPRRAAGSTGSPPPITRRSGSSTCSRRASSSWSAASRRC